MPKFVNITFPPAEQSRFNAWLNSLNGQVKSDAKRIIAETAVSIERRAKMFAPVDTGMLRSSIHHSINGLSGEVYTNRHYAPYVEFGTGSAVVAPNDVADYAMTFKGKGIRKVNLRAQPYFFPAYRLGVKELRSKFKSLGYHERPV